jgi:hypothetical protein
LYACQYHFTKAIIIIIINFTLCFVLSFCYDFTLLSEPLTELCVLGVGVFLSVKIKWTRHGENYKSPQQEILIMIKISEYAYDYILHMLQ